MRSPNIFLIRLITMLLPALRGVHSQPYSFVNPNETLPSFATIASEFWRWRLEQSPEFATTLGIHDYDHRLETFTREAFAHRKDKCEGFLAMLSRIDRSLMSEWERNNMVFLQEELETYVRGYRWSRLSSLNPINHLEGLHKDYSFWLDAMKFEKEEDFTKYIQRLRALATQINEQISLMREAIRLGWTNHRISIEPVITKLNRMDPRPPRTAFYRPFNDSIYTLGFSSNKIEKLKLQGDVVIYDHVLPAYRKLKYFLTQEYLPNTRPQVGISTLPGGRNFYQEVIKWHLSIDVNPEELHAMGRRLVVGLRERIDKIRHRVGYIGNMDSFMRYTTKTPKFFYSSEEELLNGYKNMVYKQIRPRLKYIFRNITLMPLQVWKMPFDGPPGIAMPPADDGSMPGIFFVNVRRPHKQPKWRMLPLSLHESLPGHHFQACYALNGSIPKYRRVREFRKMFAIPFQFPFQAAYTEGWGVYAETLGRDLGLNNNPFDEFGLLLSDLTNTVRLVTDTGIHALKWSRERAVRFYSTKTGEPRHRAEEEVDRFITIPGQALQYKVGHMKIEQLRYRAETLLGDEFDVKEFHHQVLRLGPVSLRTLENVIDRWIQAISPYSSSASPSTRLLSYWSTALVGASLSLAILHSLIFNSLRRIFR